MSHPGNDKGSVQSQVENYVAQLQALIRRGEEVREQLSRGSSNVPAVAAARAWQEHCGVLINQLSGGSKAHWLARAFSEAFLMRSASGQALEGVPASKIVERVLGVLEQAAASLTRPDNPPIVTSTMEPTPRRFDFVNNAALQPVLEQAYAESRSALDKGEFDTAMRSACGVLEAMVTDALQQKGTGTLAAFGAPAGEISGWGFEARLSIAEKTGLIRGGWVRLTETARRYREESAPPATEQDARRAVQVLNVILRDLNPGR